MPRKKVKETIEDVVIGSPRKQQGSLLFVEGLVVAGVIVMMGAVLVGKSDTGPINVSATIQESNKTAESEGREQVQVVSPVFQNMVNGGLVAEGDQEDAVPRAPVEESLPDSASTTATSTEEIEATDESDTSKSSEITEETNEAVTE